MKRTILISTILLIFNPLTYGQPQLTTKSNYVDHSVDALFEISNLNNDSLSLYIYNRWGELIISKIDSTPLFDTHSFTLNINEFPKSQTYYYSIAAGDSLWNGFLTVKYPNTPTIEVQNPIITDTSDLKLRISYLQSDTITVTIFNIIVSTIKTEIDHQILYGEHEFTFSLTDFDSDGVYLLHVNINDSTIITKFIVSTKPLNLSESFNSEEPSIYPNPFSNRINIANFEKMKSVSLTSIDNQSYWSGNSLSELTYLLESSESGIYILQFQIDDKDFIKKIIKE